MGTSSARARDARPLLARAQEARMQYGGNQGGGFGQPRQNKRMVMVDARKSYTNSWSTDLMGAPCRNPGFCLYAADAHAADAAAGAAAVRAAGTAADDAAAARVRVSGTAAVRAADAA